MPDLIIDDNYTKREIVKYLLRYFLHRYKQYKRNNFIKYSFALAKLVITKAVFRGWQNLTIRGRTHSV